MKNETTTKSQKTETCRVVAEPTRQGLQIAHICITEITGEPRRKSNDRTLD